MRITAVNLFPNPGSRFPVPDSPFPVTTFSNTLCDYADGTRALFCRFYASRIHDKRGPLYSLHMCIRARRMLQAFQVLMKIVI